MSSKTQTKETGGSGVAPDPMEQNANTKGKRTTLKHLKNNRKLKHTWLGSDEEKVVYPPPVEGEDATGSGSEDVMLQPVLCQLTRRPAMRMEPEPVLQAEQCLNYLDCLQRPGSSKDPVEPCLNCRRKESAHP